MYRKLFVVFPLLFVSPAFFGGCETFEEAGEEVDDAVDDAGDAIDDAVDEID